MKMDYGVVYRLFVQPVDPEFQIFLMNNQILQLYLAADCVPVTSVASRRHLRSAVSGCLAVTGTRTTLGRRNFAVTRATIWNNLPADLRLHSQSLLSFGQKLKQYLFEP